MKKLYLLIFFNIYFCSLFGQYQIGIVPRVSPDKMIYQKIGFTEVEIKYGSPEVKDRQIWGALVPYSKVWRAGANSATTVEFRSMVTIGGIELDSGKYSFFVIPKENDKWTVIFNKVAKQWGAFRYNEKEDALRLEVRPRINTFKTENLTYTIQQTGFKYGSIVLSWDFIELEIPFETNYLTIFKENIEARAAAQPDYIKWIPYIQGAEHLVKIDSDIEQAKKWINQAEELMKVTQEWNKQFYPRDYVKGHLYWIKAKILAQENDFTNAVAYVDKLKQLDNPLFYTRKREREEIDLHYDKWKSE